MADKQYKEHGERLKKIRQHLNFSQVEMAEMLKITQSHLSALENGKYALTLDLLILLKSIMPDLSLSWLVAGEGDMCQTYKLAAEPDIKYDRLTRIETFLKDHFPDF